MTDATRTELLDLELRDEQDLTEVAHAFEPGASASTWTGYAGGAGQEAP